ncbi:MAG: hypothetical protein ACJ8DJ_07330 [Gemmatimonadales bacterium]
MSDLTASRTLVKSPPELWSELSEVEALARHLGELGEIRITRVEPEHTVAWEGERAKGTVSLEPSGWGTTVTFTAEMPEAPEAAAETRRGVFTRLFPGFWVEQPKTQPEPEAPNEDPQELRAVLDGALDTLGSAHHRPFSRG